MDPRSRFITLVLGLLTEEALAIGFIANIFLEANRDERPQMRRAAERFGSKMTK